MKTVKAPNVLVYLCTFAQTATILNCVVKVSGRKSTRSPAFLTDVIRDAKIIVFLYVTWLPSRPVALQLTAILRQLLHTMNERNV
jgi:hypothetical protein